MWGGVFINVGLETRVLLTWTAILLVICLLLLLVAVMIPPGQWVGYYLDIAPDPISAYSANLLGSVAGIWGFAGLAFISLSPPYWFCLAFLILALIDRGHRRLVFLSLLLAGVAILLFQLGGTPGMKTPTGPPTRNLPWRI